MRHTVKTNILVKYRHAKRVSVYGTPVRMLNPSEIREMSSYVDEVRRVRIGRGAPMAKSKVCRGCEQTLPQTRDFFTCRVRKGHSDYWNPFCRKCKRLRLDRKPKAAP